MINLIVACGEDRVIGKNGRLPWTIQEDWDYFMDTTSGGSMIMGKICYQEFEKHIADREVIALTKVRHSATPMPGPHTLWIRQFRWQHANQSGFAEEKLFTGKHFLWRAVFI